MKKIFLLLLSGFFCVNTIGIVSACTSADEEDYNFLVSSDNFYDGIQKSTFLLTAQKDVADKLFAGVYKNAKAANSQFENVFANTAVGKTKFENYVSFNDFINISFESSYNPKSFFYKGDEVSFSAEFLNDDSGNANLFNQGFKFYSDYLTDSKKIATSLKTGQLYYLTIKIRALKDIAGSFKKFNIDNVDFQEATTKANFDAYLNDTVLNNDKLGKEGTGFSAANITTIKNNIVLNINNWNTAAMKWETVPFYVGSSSSILPINISDFKTIAKEFSVDNELKGEAVVPINTFGPNIMNNAYIVPFEIINIK